MNELSFVGNASIDNRARGADLADSDGAEVDERHRGEKRGPEQPQPRQCISTESVPTQCSTTCLDLDVTDSCNLACVYCFKNELNGPGMQLETAKDAVTWLLRASGDAPSVNVNFMGGEPTLRWKLIKELVPWARRRGNAVGKTVTFSLTSNLTLWTDEIRDFVDRYGFGVLMSIDGCPEVQDAQRPAKNGKPMSAIVEKWARSLLASRARSTARATLHPRFVRLLTKSVDYLHSLGFSEIAIANASYSEWTDAHFVDLRVQLREVVEKVAESYERDEGFSLTVWNYYVAKLIHPRSLHAEVEINRQPCGAGKNYLMIDRRGDIWPCHRFDGADEDAKTNGEFRMGNIYKSGFNQRLQNAFIDFDHLANHKARCTTCPVNEICGGFCPAANVSATGSLYTPHDAFCEWSQCHYEAATELYERLKRSEGVLKRFLARAQLSTSDGQR